MQTISNPNIKTQFYIKVIPIFENMYMKSIIYESALNSLNKGDLKNFTVR